MTCGKIDRKSTCGGLKTSSICIVYEGDLPDWSELKEMIPGCVSIEETTQEIYNKVSDIEKSLDTSNIGNECLSYAKNDDGKIVQSIINATFEKEICYLKNSSSSSGGICNTPMCFDSSLTDQCSQPIKTLVEWMRAVENKLSSL